MAITLPYEFDTARETRLIVKGMLGLEFVLIVGIVYSLVFSANKAVVLPLVLAGSILLFFIIRFVKHLDGSTGVITATEIVVRPATACGLEFPGPAGTFSLHEFSAVCVEESSGPSSPDVQGGPHERVYLVGKNGAPDILIARTGRGDRDRGIRVGQELGRLLSLPCQQKRVPY